MSISPPSHTKSQVPTCGLFCIHYGVRSAPPCCTSFGFDRVPMQSTSPPCCPLGDSTQRRPVTIASKALSSRHFCWPPAERERSDHRCICSQNTNNPPYLKGFVRSSSVLLDRRSSIVVTHTTHAGHTRAHTDTHGPPTCLCHMESSTTRCNCTSALLILYAQIESAAAPTLDVLLGFVDRAIAHGRTVLGCSYCARSNISLATVSALAHHLIEAIDSFVLSSPGRASTLAAPGNSVFLGWYELSMAESTLLIFRLLSSRLDELDTSVLVPMRELVDGHARRHGRNPATAKLVAACHRALMEAARLMSTLRRRLHEAEKDVVG